MKGPKVKATTNTTMDARMGEPRAKGIDRGTNSKGVVTRTTRTKARTGNDGDTNKWGISNNSRGTTARKAASRVAITRGTDITRVVETMGPKGRGTAAKVTSIEANQRGETAFRTNGRGKATRLTCRGWKRRASVNTNPCSKEAASGITNNQGTLVAFKSLSNQSAPSKGVAYSNQSTLLAFRIISNQSALIKEAAFRITSNRSNLIKGATFRITTKGATFRITTREATFRITTREAAFRITIKEAAFRTINSQSTPIKEVATGDRNTSSPGAVIRVTSSRDTNIRVISKQAGFRANSKQGINTIKIRGIGTMGIKARGASSFKISRKRFSD
jgi:hypothetical protein